MYFIEVPSKDWTFDAAQSHYINKEVNQRAQALRNLKSDLEKIVKSENFTREAVQKAKQYFNNYDHWKKKVPNTAAAGSSKASTIVNNFTGNKTVTQKNTYNVSKSIKSFKRKHQEVETEVETDNELSETNNNAKEVQLEYLEGGEGPVEINDDTLNWNLPSGLNVSAKFHEFRNKSIKKVEQLKKPANIYEELALNGIMFLEDRARILYRIKEDDWRSATSMVNDIYNKSRDDFPYLDKVHEISKLLSQNLEQGIEKANLWYAECIKTKNNGLIPSKVLSDLINNIKNNNLETMKEPLYSSLVIEPVVRPHLCLSENVILKGNTEECNGSRTRRGSHCRIPDLSVNVELDESCECIFLCEIKTPQYMKSIKMNEDPNPDFIKLINEMKDELDLMDSVKKDDRVVYGLLVQGYKCRLFAMDLYYYKLYRLVLLSQFYVPRDAFDIDTTTSCLESMVLLKNLLSISTTNILDTLCDATPIRYSPERKQNLTLISFRSPHRS